MQRTSTTAESPVVVRVGVERGGAHISVAAVMVFFVLSGYLVGGSVLRSMEPGWDWRTYTKKRLVRLWTVLLPALLLGTFLDKLGVQIFGPHSVYGAPVGMEITVAANLAAR